MNVIHSNFSPGVSFRRAPGPESEREQRNSDEELTRWGGATLAIIGSSFTAVGGTSNTPGLGLLGLAASSIGTWVAVKPDLDTQKLRAPAKVAMAVFCAGTLIGLAGLGIHAGSPF